MNNTNALFLAMLMMASDSMASTASAAKAEPDPLPSPPPQDQGLPYTRSAQAKCLALIKDYTAVFVGSRYAYVKGHKVRLDETAWHAEAERRADGDVYVPKNFADAILAPSVSFDVAPGYLKTKWVYTIKGRPCSVDPAPWVSLNRAVQEKGWILSSSPRGLVVIGEKPFSFEMPEAQLDALITQFDTPEKYADASLPPKYILSLKKQGVFTEHVKTTPEQLAILNGPETKWKTTPKADFDEAGFNRKMLGAKVPPPGVYPRILFSPEDVPIIAKRIESQVLGKKSLIEMEVLFKKSWWNPDADDGKLFDKLSSGDIAEFRTKHALFNEHPFAQYKPGIMNSHVAYIPECLTAMGLYALLKNDDGLGKKVAHAFVNYYRLREPFIDAWNSTSDSEFGSSAIQGDGSLFAMNGNGSTTHWRGMHGTVAHMNLGLGFDFCAKWMDDTQKKEMYRIIAKATYGRRAYGQDAPIRFRDVNWVGWDLPHYLALLAIEGQEGIDREALEENQKTVRAFCEWGIDPSGVVFESNGKSPGSFQFVLHSMVALARRGENLFGHPHWRNLLVGQIQMTSPSGRVVVNSGTQYAPHSRQKLSPSLVDAFKAFYPEQRLSDYLLTQFRSDPEEAHRWSLAFNPETYAQEIAKERRLRLPSPTYPGFVRSVLYDTDYLPATREELALPLDFHAPVQGIASSYSDRSTNGIWICLQVRPNHYLGAGHHHADAGMFHFSGLGVDWFTESTQHQNYMGKLHNQVLVDGRSQAEPLVRGERTYMAQGAPLASVASVTGQVAHKGIFLNGYNAAGVFLGMKSGKDVSMASADLTYAYSYRWCTQPAQDWSGEGIDTGWEVEPAPEILKIFAGTARYKLRPWWMPLYSNYIPTSRAPYNPMAYVFRSTVLVRGTHSYGLVIDDLKKDDKPRLYQWTAMLGGGIWQAEVEGLAENQMVLAKREELTLYPSPRPLITPQPGEPLLLVCALGMKQLGNEPLLKVSQEPCGADRYGKETFYQRIAIAQTAQQVNYRVLLIPFRMGEPLPQVSGSTVTWNDQTDSFDFTTGPDGRTHSAVTRKSLAGTARHSLALQFEER
jgi:hypothetical protein